MDRVAPVKIHIIGSVGSGKSTLARTLAGRLGIPCYELDNVVWRRSPGGDIRNSEADRDAFLMDIVNSPQWILEGVHHRWVSAAFCRSRADYFSGHAPRGKILPDYQTVFASAAGNQTGQL
ncbi:hypothetical protein [Paenibacillus tengchongensis]|uniref:hypothetical protein n=1 Tax=Paenibacillus tengchongensis TaxID=2608684 RepID=UPI001FE731CE|nr:hypothetical protein [Paenibacillus tengchongensis]